MRPLLSIAQRVEAPIIAAAVGSVVAIRGPLVIAKIPYAALGDMCVIDRRSLPPLLAQVVSFSESLVTLAPFDSLEGIYPGTSIHNSGRVPHAEIPRDPLGRVLDALGEPLDSMGRPSFTKELQLTRLPPAAMSRSEISEVLPTGISTIDGLCTLGRGQRVGLFAAAGVGKSTLLGMLARNAKVDAIVVGLIGERGREVNEFIRDSLGTEGLKRSVVIVSTSNESPIRRIYAAYTATAIAEYYRSQGKHVLLLIDSITRMARALREIGLAAGEIPVRHGFTPSVYSELPKLLERAGTNQYGAITAIYTLLLQDEKEPDPLAEEVKSLLDGHIFLSSEIAQSGVHPAIDPLLSTSRLFNSLNRPLEISIRSTILRIISRIRRDRDILLLGGTPDKELKSALALEQKINSLMNQSLTEYVPLDETRRRFQEIALHFSAIKEINN